MKIPMYKPLKNPKEGQTLVIDKSTASIRPHCVAAVLRNVCFTKERYFIVNFYYEPGILKTVVVNQLLF